MFCRNWKRTELHHLKAYGLFSYHGWMMLIYFLVCHTVVSNLREHSGKQMGNLLQEPDWFPGRCRVGLRAARHITQMFPDFARRCCHKIANISHMMVWHPGFWKACLPWHSHVPMHFLRASKKSAVSNACYRPWEFPKIGRIPHNPSYHIQTFTVYEYEYGNSWKFMGFRAVPLKNSSHFAERLRKADVWRAVCPIRSDAVEPQGPVGWSKHAVEPHVLWVYKNV